MIQPAPPGTRCDECRGTQDVSRYDGVIDLCHACARKVKAKEQQKDD